MNGFARRLVLTQKQKATRKWYIIKVGTADAQLTLHGLRPLT